MVKRKAEIGPSTGSGAEGCGVKAGRSEVAAKSGQGDATIGSTGQADLGGVPASHVELVPATVAEEEGQAGLGGVPANHVKLVPATVAEEESLAASPFWELLKSAGYEPW